MKRLGKNGKAKPDRFRKARNLESIRIRSALSGWCSSSGRKKLSRGASLRGQGTPADPARLRSERARNSSEFSTLQAVRISGVLACGFASFADFRIAVRQEVAPSLPENLYFTFPRPRAGIRTARWQQPRRPLLLPAVRCAARARGSVPGPVPPV